MDLSLYIILSILGPIFFIITFIVVKLIVKRELPDSRYTPFDYITGQTTVQFQEHKEAKEQEDDEGDDKD